MKGRDLSSDVRKRKTAQKTCISYFAALTAIVVLFLNALSTHAAEIKVDKIFLYLPDEVMKQRCDNLRLCTGYIAKINNRLHEAFAELDAEINSSVGLIVTVRPNNESKVWFETKSGYLSPRDKVKISNAIEAVSVPDVKSGIILFSFGIRVGESDTIITKRPIADEWQRAYKDKDKKSSITSIIAKSWSSRALLNKVAKSRN